MYMLRLRVILILYIGVCLQLQKLTVPVLKDYLKSVDKKPAGRKQDLIDAINEHLGL